MQSHFIETPQCSIIAIARPCPEIEGKKNNKVLGSLVWLYASLAGEVLFQLVLG